MVFKKSSFIKVIMVCLIFLSYNLNGLSQVFTPLDCGIDPNFGEVKSIYFDSISNKLYAGGLFSTTCQGLTVNGLTQWNGVMWDSMQTGITSPGVVFSITKFQGNILIGGSFNSLGSVNSAGLIRWDGSSFQPFASLSCGGGCVDKVETIANNLYVGGGFDNINSLPANGFAKYDGVNWTTYPPLNSPVNYTNVYDIEEYNGEMYVGGEIEVPGISPSIYALVKWNGTQWQRVGSGFLNPNDYVSSMAVFQNELYVAGYFFSNSGSPGNFIAKWNGSNWSQLGSGVAGGSVQEIIEYNNELYVGGLISDAGGVSVSAIAKWDGSQWYVVPGGTFSFPAGVLTFSRGNGDLYMAGRFTAVGTQVCNNVVKYNVPVGIKNEYHTNLSVTVNPTLAHDVIKFSYNTIVQSTGDVKIYNSAGQVVYSACSITLNHAEFDVSHLPAGVYHLRVYAKDGEGGARFVKR